MSLRIFFAAMYMAAMITSSSHAEMVRFRVDVEVINLFTGIPVGTQGTVTVEYEDTLLDQRTTENFHQFFGLYGFPDLPPVTILWEYGGTNAVYTEQGAISVIDAPFSFNADIYAVDAGNFTPEGITKGAFENWVFLNGTALKLTDLDDAIISGQALIPPNASFIPSSEFNTGGVQFFGNSAFIADIATNITVLDTSTNTSALFTAGSPASLNQPIATPATVFDINFNVSFDSAATAGGGSLQVLLEGTALGTINANTATAGVVTPTTIQVNDVALWGLNAADLVFLFDGPNGSTMTLDNIVIPGSDLLNGDFETQSLAAWDTTGPGTIAAQVTAIPEPASITILGLAALLACASWLRH